MAKFKVINKGTNQDGTFWTMVVANDESDFVKSAIVRTKKDLVKNNEIEIPKELADTIKWKV